MKKRVWIALAVFALVIASCSDDAGECGGYKNPNVVNSCFIYLSVDENDASLCSNSKSSQQSSDYCYYYFSQEKGIVDSCSQIKDLGLKDSCIEKVSVSMNDSEHCSEITGIPSQSRCYGGIARSKADYDICLKINSETRDSCILGVNLPKTQNLCEYFLTADGKDKCLMSVSISEKSNEFCGRINGIKIRDNCYFQNAKLMRNYDSCLAISNEELKALCSKLAVI